MVNSIDLKFWDGFLAKGWEQILSAAISSDEMSALKVFLNGELSAGKTIYPPMPDVFRALNMVDFQDVRVVILGQDPYHGEMQANGLAFAVHDGIKAPPSLRNIFKEIASDFSSTPPRGTTLEGWAQQGVLLLNTVLTVRAHEAFSHRGQGWEKFTEEIIRALNNHADPLVFLLWGMPAHKKESLIDSRRHLILKAAHPSPLSAHRGFFGCKHFSKANSFLSPTCRQIDWFKSAKF